jgi:hypothetical protein
MTNIERKKIEKALKFVNRNKGAMRKILNFRNWRLTTAMGSVDCYDKPAKKLGVVMYEPIVEYFIDAGDEDKEILVVLLHRLYRFYKLETIPAFFINIILNDSISMKVRNYTADMLSFCFAAIPLDKIKEIYNIKDFQLDILRCLPFCENKERHEFAIELLKEQTNPQIVNKAVNSLITEKIVPDEADLLKTIYTQSKDPHLRYPIMELLYKSTADDLHDFYITAYKKERLLPNRLQAIIGLYLKGDISSADKIMNEFTSGILKRKNMDERTKSDLRFVVEWLDKLKELYPSKGFHHAYETLSSMVILKK